MMTSSSPSAESDDDGGRGGPIETSEWFTVVEVEDLGFFWRELSHDFEEDDSDGKGVLVLVDEGELLLPVVVVVVVGRRVAL